MGLKVASDVRDAPITLSYQEAKQYAQIFKTFDKDRDGHISIHDLRKALREMGETVDDEQLSGFIAEVDIDKNATIEEEEFLQVGVAGDCVGFNWTSVVLSWCGREDLMCIN